MFRSIYANAVMTHIEKTYNVNDAFDLKEIVEKLVGKLSPSGKPMNSNIIKSGFRELYSLGYITQARATGFGQWFWKASAAEIFEWKKNNPEKKVSNG